MGSAAVNGIGAFPVEVEVDSGFGQTVIVIVGLPDAAVKEARDRVTTALSNSAFRFPMGRTTINLAPADVKKEGPSFDLPIAIGILAASEQFVSDQLDHFVMVGELALTGKVRPVKGVLPIALRAILPPLTLDEALETTKIHSIMGLLEPGQALITRRPFRAPHHTASDAGLLGGNINPTPGEISLAHHGVLFMDELPEFKRNVLETLRQPLEEGRVTISRAAGTVTFPSQFMLVAAMNPTPDGKMPGESHCSPREIQNYLNRVSGPLLDRIDLHIEVPAVKFQDITSQRNGEPSATIRERVIAARHVQQQRFKHRPRITCNARMGTRELKAHCALDESTLALLQAAMAEYNLSARAYDRILKVSRTIADLEGSDRITADHVGEAVGFRALDRQLWR